MRPERHAASSSSNPRLEVDRSTEGHDFPAACVLLDQRGDRIIVKVRTIGLTGRGACVCLKDASGDSRLYPKLYPLSGAFDVIWYENPIAAHREFEPVFTKPTRSVRLDSRSAVRSC
jgi:hypothetical protein